MPGKPWTLDEEKRLKEMLEAGESLDVIYQRLGRNRDAISVKAKRLGLDVVAQIPLAHTTTMLEMPKELMDPEEALKILVAALNVSRQPGLDKVEVQRLMAIAALARTYNSLYKDYERFQEVEKQLVEINKRLESLESIDKLFREKPALLSYASDAEKDQAS